jgi:hypothetical protein
MNGYTCTVIENVRTKNYLRHDNVSPSLNGIYSGSSDNASGLRVIGSLLLDKADSFAHYRIVKRGYFNRTTEY